MISEGIKVNKFGYVCLISERKFGYDSQLGSWIFALNNLFCFHEEASKDIGNHEVTQSFFQKGEVEMQLHWERWIKLSLYHTVKLNNSCSYGKYLYYRLSTIQNPENLFVYWPSSLWLVSLIHFLYTFGQ